MFPSATLCRAQEAAQHQRAAAATLDNVRTIALAAAAAWGEEGGLAEKREARAANTQRLARVALAAKQALELGLSENPDRGLVPGADPAAPPPLHA
ncbi:hypothetical protein ACFOMD_02045 [Sphingoaurantiacus capsulatus]|uniref:Uncharacterized protein n=1 Tax=Sphingoaurantiacus capsulatus TaxID=1771310 RepID=A0ABV7X6H0_9SPHN